MSSSVAVESSTAVPSLSSPEEACKCCGHLSRILDRGLCPNCDLEQREVEGGLRPGRTMQIAGDGFDHPLIRALRLEPDGEQIIDDYCAAVDKYNQAAEGLRLLVEDDQAFAEKQESAAQEVSA